MNKLAKQIQAGTGGFVTGPAAIDGVVTAIKRAHGSLVGSKLAAVMQKFHKVPDALGQGELLEEAALGLRPASTA